MHTDNILSATVLLKSSTKNNAVSSTTNKHLNLIEQNVVKIHNYAVIYTKKHTNCSI